MSKMDKNNTSDIGTTELAVGGVAFTVAFLLLSDDSDGSGGGVVPTIQRVVPEVPVVEQVTNSSGNNSGGVEFSEFTDSITDLGNTGTDAVDTVVDAAEDAGSNIGVDLPDVTDPDVTDAVVDSAVDANPAASAVNDVVNIVSGNGNDDTGSSGGGGGGGDDGDFQDSVNDAFSDFV